MMKFGVVAILFCLALRGTFGDVETTTDANNDNGDVFPNNNGQPYNEDQENGQAYEKGKQNQDEIDRRRSNETTGDPTQEMEILAAEEHYNAWLNEYFSTGVMSEPSTEVQNFMEVNKITNDTIQDEYEKHKNSGTGGRKRRSYLQSNAGVWTKCIIPYVYESITDSDKVGMEKVHQYWEKYTGFRFVEFNATTTQEQYGLDHNNYIRYVRASGCWSYVGNLRGNGQRLSPCGGGGVAIHEIGHALGMMHEQKNPQSFRYIRNEFQNINPSYRSQYTRNDIDALDDRNGIYDISSRMHYSSWGFNINYARTMTTNDPEYNYLIGSGNDFYMFKELQEYHNCYDEFDSCDVKPTCFNGGYVSVVDGKCQCQCSPELNLDTNCTTKLGTDVALQSLTWPEGKYTLLKTSVADCPDNFENGTMVHWPASHIWSSNTYRHSPPLKSYELGHDVCTKTNSTAGTAVWQSGDYCILRYGGTCPEGFTMGYQDTYGPVKRNDSNVGALPDGDHTYPFEYIYCCRNDGDRDNPIKLPTIQPFILYQRNNWGCQRVEGMLVMSEYFDFKSDTSETLNETGLLPYMYRFDDHRRNIYYCFYTPVTKDCGELVVFNEGQTSFTFTSPNYPGNYDNAMDCFWHFTSPEGTRMQLDFNDFEVSAAESSSCNDYVEISFTEPSMKGFSVCGHGYKKTTWTWDNFLSLHMVTRTGTTYKGFNATITVFKDSQLCYNGDGSDGSYTGDVNYVKSFQPCIPWYKATNCLFNKFDSKAADMRLYGNTCRNVVVGTQPWCYTNAETCERQSCDVCMWGSCYDIYTDCEDQIAKDEDYCTKNEFGEAYHGCMETCGLCQARVAQSRGSCATPPVVKGITPVSDKTSYDVGDVVTYNCPTSRETRTSTCTSDGSWSKVNTVCESCPTGFAPFHQRCFKWLGYTVKVDYATAVAMCNETGSVLVKVDSPEISKFVQRIVEYDEYDNTNVWIGAEADGNRVWRWADGTLVSDGWTNWGSGQPNDWGRNQDCGQMEYDEEWDDTVCTNQKSVVCEYQFDKTGMCDNQRSECDSLLRKNPDMCTQYPIYALHNCKQTCGVQDCKSDSQCVDDTQPEYQTLRTAGEDNISPGQYVAYECQEGFIKKSGDDIRICMPSGNLTGSSLVCEATDVCNDFLDNCDDILRKNAKICVQNPDLADRYCRSTCGVESCSPNVNCTDEGSQSNSTTRQYGSDVLSIGQYVEYSCDTGTLKTSGDYVRVCQSSGNFSGSPLTCAAKVQCEDKVTTCEATLTETPDMCELHATYAWKNCIQTCAFAECKVSTTCADDTDQGVAAFRKRGSAKINVGDFLEYTCGEGFMKTGGDPKRACLPSGVLTGEPIICSPIGEYDSDHQECDNLLSENPKLCEDDKQFAWHTCRDTCGFGSSVHCMDDTQNTSTTNLLKGSNQLTPGQYLEYECSDGHLRESGDYIRVCLPSGNLSGSPLTCPGSTSVINCEDLYKDCETRLEMNPTLCGASSVYVAYSCRKSCGVQDCKPNTTCNAVPSTESQVTKVIGSDQLSVGEYAEYECNTDLLKNTGTFKRACLPSGLLTGTDPSCLINHEVSEPSIVCEDESDCEADLQNTPDMCSKYQDYAWHNCRKSCGVGECRPRTKCADDTNLGYRATRITGNDVISVGEHIEYQCNDGYFKGSGDAVRACLPSGSLSGSPLICLHRDVTTNVDLFTDKEIYKRSEGGTRKRYVIANVTDMKFTLSGKVTSWTFFSNYADQIAFAVWRFSENETMAMTPRLIGQNVITDNPNERKYIYRVPEAEQIYAEVGDVIGIYTYDSELSYTRCGNSYQPEHATWLQTTNSKRKASEFTVGVDHTFTTSSRNCRIYSIRASVNPSACTDGFNMGYQDTYGPVKRNDSNVGTLPDGDHTNPFEYIYCCRNDGDTDNPIKLPTIQPFILYQRNYWGCQRVEGMLVMGEYFNFRSDTSETLNETGLLPYMYRFDDHRRNIYYCFYTPVTKDCGELVVFNEAQTSYTFTSPNYPGNYDNAMDCFWHFTSPEGTRMQLDFNDFEVSAAESSSCNDYVEISFTEPSMKGFSVCGHGYKKTTWTWDNVLSLHMVTRAGTTYKGFNATITVFKAKIQCKDKVTTCEATLTETPDMCELHATYAWKNCIQTCAFAECKVSTTCADDTDQGVAAFRKRGSAKINVGDFLEYTCGEGFMKTGGDPKRACLPSGVLTGEPIICSPVGDFDSDHPECDNMLAENPKLCEDDKQFAWHTCRNTCGFGASVHCMDDTQTTSTTNLLKGSNQLTPGQYLEYECSDGHLRESGDYIRVCLPSGNLSGSPLTCSGSTSVINCEDLYKDCETRLEMNPTLCGASSVYVAYYCRKSCGVQDCKPDTTCNAVPSTESQVTKVIGSDQLSVGEYAEYECNTDLLKNTGTFKRACLPSGLLTGTDPSCLINHEVSEPSIVCEDQSDCEADLQNTPDMCSKYQDYAWHNCRKSCGVGECRPRTKCADDTNLGYRATRITGNDVISVGEHIEYQCNDGYFKGSGDPVRACLPSGSLSGSTLICLHRDVTTNVDLFTDKEIYKRSEGGTRKRYVIANVTDMKFTVSEKVTSWTFFSNYADQIAFAVWRFSENETMAMTPRLIGQNVITDNPNERKYIYRVPEAEQIYAEVGDVIGIYTLYSELSYTRCDKSYQPEHATWLQTTSSKSKASWFTVGEDHAFTTSSRNCRIYSIRASVNPSACTDGD